MQLIVLLFRASESKWNGCGPRDSKQQKMRPFRKGKDFVIYAQEDPQSKKKPRSSASL
ncbi:hypothetical protein H920_16574 [Fukomys damarensis]|uniref:Uncharacterized protein n=1 Tax=Fukomys damarensis TaxID=885580 RepID=A0A091DGV2_FUKDA|nr:hypothetical protein H920_16574 [Fukomys damarensis]